MSRPNCCLGLRTNYRFLHGRDVPPAQLRQLSAGTVSALFDGADLRRITLGDQEIVRRICAAVRDTSCWDDGSYDPVPAHDPLAGRRTFSVPVDGGESRVRLNPYAVACIDA